MGTKELLHFVKLHQEEFSPNTELEVCCQSNGKTIPIDGMTIKIIDGKKSLVLFDSKEQT